LNYPGSLIGCALLSLSHPQFDDADTPLAEIRTYGEDFLELRSQPHAATHPEIAGGHTMAHKLGNRLSVVGELPWHTLCSFYETKQDLLDI